MYEALRELVVEQPGGGFRRLQAGDEVIGFGGWPVINQQAAIRTSMVRERPEGAGPAAPGHWPTVAEKRASLQQVLPTTWVGVGSGKPVEAELVDEGPVWAGQAAQPSPIAAEAAPGISIVSETIEEPSDSYLEEHICGDCDFKAASAQGLRLHMTRKHR